jgi:integrase/recombinase XerD
VEEWVEYLTTELYWGPDDPLFPATRVEGGMDQTFRPVGLERRHWTTADPIRVVFRRAFNAADLPYFPPHRLRVTLVLLGERLCQTPEQFKAWSQNLGHSGVLTTFISYGDLTAMRQAEIIRGLGRPRKTKDEVLSLLAGAVEDLRRAE